MFEDLYSDQIKILAKSHQPDQLINPHATVTKRSPLCGSTIVVQICMEGDIVTEYAVDSKACMVGTAAAQLMRELAVGSTCEELHRIRDTMLAMLKSNGEPPSGKWADLGMFQPVKDHKGRHASLMLIFDALCQAADDLKRLVASDV